MATIKQACGKRLIILVLLFGAFSQVQGKSIMVALSTESPLRRTSHKFLSLTWGTTLKNDWRSLKELPKIISLARELSPAYLRIGGIAQDYLDWDEDGRKINCCNASELDTLYHFARSSKLDIIFGLPALTRNRDDSWKCENAVELFEYIDEKGYGMHLWELGNEPNRWPIYNITNIPAEKLAKDFDLLKSLLKERGQQNARLFGPDVSHLDKFFKRFLESVRNGTLDAVTYHHYYGNAYEAVLEHFINVTILDNLINYAKKVVSVVHSTQGGNMPVWLGETSSMYNSGTPGLSNSYVAGFMWLDKLGVTALVNHSVVCRQSLSGGNYSLLEMETFEPLPDYWTSVLYKRLVGPKVLMVRDSLKLGRKARTYAHCARMTNHYGYKAGAITLFVLNLYHNEPVSLQLQDDLGKLKVDQFLLQPEVNITSKTVQLNGTPLKLLSNYKIPELKAVRVKQPFVVPALTYGFFVIPHANANACLDGK